jgi:hypothetical protein
MFNLSFIEVNVDLVSAEVSIKESVHFRNIFFSHHSESRHGVLHVQLVHFDHGAHAHSLGKVTETNVN